VKERDASKVDDEEGGGGQGGKKYDTKTEAMLEEFRNVYA
jgi:hypothetical protein